MNLLDFHTQHSQFASQRLTVVPNLTGRTQSQTLFQNDSESQSSSFTSASTQRGFTALQQEFGIDLSRLPTSYSNLSEKGCIDIISKAIQKILMNTFNDDFRKECFELLQVSSSEDATNKFQSLFEIVCGIKEPQQDENTDPNELLNEEAIDNIPLSQLRRQIRVSSTPATPVPWVIPPSIVGSPCNSLENFLCHSPSLLQGIEIIQENFSDLDEYRNDVSYLLPTNAVGPESCSQADNSQSLIERKDSQDVSTNPSKSSNNTQDSSSTASATISLAMSALNSQSETFSQGLFQESQKKSTTQINASNSNLKMKSKSDTQTSSSTVSTAFSTQGSTSNSQTLFSSQSQGPLQESQNISQQFFTGQTRRKTSTKKVKLTKEQLLLTFL